MKDADEYRFVIDACDPDTLPMSDLAEYMADLARLLGSEEQVHFVRLEAGSTVLVQQVERQAAPEVKRRIHELAAPTAPEDAIRAFAALNRRLAKDGATGSLLEGVDTEIIRFPGREHSPGLTFGAFNQLGVLDGVLIRIGGRDDTVPVHLHDGETIHVCNATRDMARDLAAYLYGPVLRVHGEGRWERTVDGIWLMKRFSISKFGELDDAPLSEIVERLRGVEGSGWQDIDDPLAEVRRLRGLDEVH